MQKNKKPPFDTENVANRLKQARKGAGLSQNQVAQLIDYHRPTISEIEAGRRKVTSEELGRFADMYEVDVNWLLGRASKESNDSDQRLLLAARELSKMSDSDIKRLMALVKMVRKSGDV